MIHKNVDSLVLTSCSALQQYIYIVYGYSSRPIPRPIHEWLTESVLSLNIVLILLLFDVELDLKSLYKQTHSPYEIYESS